MSFTSKLLTLAPIVLSLLKKLRPELTAPAAVQSMNDPANERTAAESASELQPRNSRVVCVNHGSGGRHKRLSLFMTRNEEEITRSPCSHAIYAERNRL